jgi:hypothetical protein
MLLNSNSRRSPTELVEPSRLAAQEDWRQKMRTLKPVGGVIERSGGTILKQFKINPFLKVMFA